MTSEKIKELTTKRGQIKGKITRFKTYFDSFTQELDVLQLEARFEKLQPCWDEFELIQGEIELLDDSTNQIAERDSFERQYFDLHAQVKRCILQHNKSSETQTNISKLTNGSTTHDQIAVKLPTISLPIFGGLYEEWTPFFDSFTALIHNNESLSDIQKLHYLKGALRGKATDTIKNLELTSANYTVALDLLREQFQNKKLIVRNHIKSLFDLPRVQRDSPVTLRSLLTGTLTHLRALKALQQPTDSWDALVIYLITTKLDITTYREWELSTSSDDLPCLKDLTDFLQRRCQVSENLMTQTQPLKENTVTRFAKRTNFSKPLQTHFSSHTKTCALCKKPHSTYQCQNLLQASYTERIKMLERANVCKNCLVPGHNVQQCSSSGCRRCGKKHNTALHTSDHLQRAHSSTSAQQHIVATDFKPIEPLKQQTASSINVNSEVLLSTAIVDLVSHQGQKLTCRAFLDPGSQSSFITETVCQRLKLKRERTSLFVSGINQKSTFISTKVSAVAIHSKITNYSFRSDFFVLPKITGQLPTSRINTTNWKLPTYIHLADPTFHQPGKIDVLLGQEYFLELLEGGKITGENMPTFQNTKLGWIVGGRASSIQEYRPTINCNINVMEKLDLQLQKFWNLEELQPGKLMTSEESDCEKLFAETVQRTAEGRYVVTMPLKETPAVLGRSKETATRRLFQVERRLTRQPVLRQQYSDFLGEYANLGHMSLVTGNDVTKTNYYMPHHPVLKESSTTTKLRVVFDASAKTSSGISLNNILMVGPTVQDDLFSILLRFRLHVYVMSADIEKMYRQVLINPSQRDLLRIVWRENDSAENQSYQLNTVTYGTACAPYLATRTLKQLAVDERNTFPEASETTLNDFYVDDLITGSDDLQKAIELQKQLTSMLKAGGFHLRKWKSNNDTILQHLTQDARERLPQDFTSRTATSKTLGVLWDAQADDLMFSYTGEVQGDNHKITKRIVLSKIATLFDPLGLISPVIVQAKIYMQELWKMPVSWDDELPSEFKLKWLHFQESLFKLNQLHIKRGVKPLTSEGTVELHGYCDASEKAYGAAVFVRHASRSGPITVSLLCAKSRVAPIKTVSLPRLELCGALLLAELMSHVNVALKPWDKELYYWTDSTIVLAWIASEAATWKTFVANRVAKIQDLSKVAQWRHVRSEDNPADILSRGATTEKLLFTSLWWSGPEWLSKEPEHWLLPTQTSTPIEESLERRKRHTTAAAATIKASSEDFTTSLLNKFSTLQKLIRVASFCKRFIYNCRSTDQRKHGPLSSGELNSTLNTLIKLDQEIHFSKDLVHLKNDGQVKNNSKLVMLKPFIDHTGNIRVGGRLSNSDLEYNIKHPILMSDKSVLTELILKHEHMRGVHAGPQLLLSLVRQNYWPLNGRNLARKTVHRCVTCFKAKPKWSQPSMGDLPKSRTSPARPFTSTGVDYCGPILIRSSKARKASFTKGYVAIFVCFATKAIHLELVSDLTTEAFCAAFRRFIARRGICQNVYSDNGTNFVGAQRELQDLYKLLRSNDHQRKISDTFSLQQITWHFLPPKSPHFGGLWEAGVKSMKYHLRRVIGNSSLTFEGYYTVLTTIEACLNSRPLTPLSSDPNDPQPLTPGHFLTGKALTSLPELDLTETPDNRLTHWQRVQQITQHFWGRWSKEYLAELQQRQKWTAGSPDIQVGQIVLVKDDNLPPLKWIMGIVKELHPGRDGRIRVATIKTSTSQYKRAVNRLCVLPID